MEKIGIMYPLEGQSAGQKGDTATIKNILNRNIVRDWSVAIDGGANIGSWTSVLAGAFKSVVAFEPCEESFSMLRRNMKQFKNVKCRNEALMDVRGRVDVLAPDTKRQKLTSRIVQKNKRGAIACVAIDDLGLESCGLIKLDLEGAEGMAINGARETIKKFKPALVVEIWGMAARFGHSAVDIHESIVSNGYRYIFRSSVDHVYTHKEN